MKNKLLIVLYLIFIFLLALYAYKRPACNWDMLAYMAVVISYDHHDPGFVHDTVYSIAHHQLPASTDNLLTDGGIEFRKKVAVSPAEFYQQMPFYSVKPLYTGLIYVMLRMGVPLIRATVLPSFIAYFLIGALLIVWLKKYMSLLLALSISALTMLSAPMWEIVRDSSPDCLSAFLLFTAAWFVLEIKSLRLTYLFLLLSVFARLDNVVPAFFILSLLAFSDTWLPKITIKKYLLLLSGIALSFFLISLTARPFGWDILYYPTFAKSLNLSYSSHPAFQLKDYFALAISHIMTGLYYSNLCLFLILGMLLFMGPPALRNRPSASLNEPPAFRNGPAAFRLHTLSFDQLFAGMIMLTIMVRFILQPNIADRFYIAYYLCILILLIRKIYAGNHPGLTGST